MGGAAGVTLDVLVTAQVRIPDPSALRAGQGLARRLPPGWLPRSRGARSPCLAFAVHHPKAGTILIDTGMHPHVGRILAKDFGPGAGMALRGLRPSPVGYVAQLRALGIDATAVKHVLMTHLHADHASGMRLLPRAEFTCSRREWNIAHSRWAPWLGYSPKQLPPRERMRLVKLKAGEPFGPFAMTIDLLGDGSIRLISTPGHTGGHLSILLRLADGPPVLLIGDAVYRMRSIRDRKPETPATDEVAALRTIAALRAYADAEPDAILVPSHDPKAWRALADVSPSAAAAVAAWTRRR